MCTGISTHQLFLSAGEEIFGTVHSLIGVRLQIGLPYDTKLPIVFGFDYHRVHTEFTWSYLVKKYIVSQSIITRDM